MRFKVKDALREEYGRLPKGFFRERAFVEKIAILVVVCAISAVVFFPSFSFINFNYKAGDIVMMDLKSPADINTTEFSIKKGEIVVREGHRVQAEDIEKFTYMEEALKSRRYRAPITGAFVFMLALIMACYLFARGGIKRFSSSSKDMLFMSVVFLGLMMLIRFSGIAAPVLQAVFPFVPSTVYIYIVPIAAGAMLVRLFLNAVTALLFAAVSSIMAGMFLAGSLDFAAYFFIGGVVAALEARHATQRATVLKAGVYLGIVNCIVLLSLAAIRGGASVWAPLSTVSAGLLNGIITAVLVIGIAPIVEILFGYTTNIRLLELSRMDHPLLKDLAIKAPGTYHHSIVIGTLVEAAAESIGANPLLARVSAYYHDIGKTKKPLYFIENMKGENKHDKLTPSMSALVIGNHVKEGIELAKQYRLGKEITDAIPQHHGTSLMRFFYDKALKEQDADMHEVNEKDFRYPGPKPQTKETGILMLADAIEAASRTLPDPTPAKIQGMTQKLVNRIFADGQLDECELTLKDLHAITSSFNRVLSGIFHQRINYPDPVEVTKKKKEDTGEGGDDGKSGGKGGAQGKAEKDKKGGRDNLRRLGIK